ncbi:MAG: hypothetical protein KBT31_06730, partial [Firmicutes bacterium]|nr:hypothetical protein [Candidatus Colimorpha enterica]
TAVISFGGDVASPYDGYWFYGIHSAELCICLCGEDYLYVDSYKNGDSVISLVKYSDHSCVIVTNPRNADLHITITGQEGSCHKFLPLNYQSVGPAEFMEMIEKKELPRPLSHYVAATRLVNDIIASYEKEAER